MSTAFDSGSEEWATATIKKNMRSFSFSYPIDSLPPVLKTSEYVIGFRHYNEGREYKVKVCLAEKAKTPWAFQVVARRREFMRAIEDPFWLGDLARIERLCDNLMNMQVEPIYICMGEMAYGFFEWSNSCTAPAVVESVSEKTEPSESLPAALNLDYP